MELLRTTHRNKIGNHDSMKITFTYESFRKYMGPMMTFYLGNQPGQLVYK